MVNASITTIAPYQGHSLRSLEYGRRQHELDDVNSKTKDNKLAARQIGAVSSTASAVNQQHTRHKYPVNRSVIDMDESGNKPPLSTAHILMQLINEMGGSGMNSGPGRVFDIVI